MMTVIQARRRMNMISSPSDIFLWIKEPRWYGFENTIRFLFSYVLFLCAGMFLFVRAPCGCLSNCIAYSFATAFFFPYNR